MYGAAGIQAIYEQELLSGKGPYGNWDPGLWREREQWKTGARVRLRPQMTSRWELSHRSILAAGQTGETLFLTEKKKKVPVRSRFAATIITPSFSEAAAKAGSRKVTGSEAEEVCPVPFTETEGLLDQFPLKATAGIVLESVGTLYTGPDEEKYWSQNRCGLRHPYPVGYSATKTYKGVQFKQAIERGPNGPIFVVRELDKAPCSADSPTKAWSLALASSQLKSATRVHGRKHFGFDCPVVLGCLSEMSKEHFVRKELGENVNFNLQNEEPSVSLKEDAAEKLNVDGKEGTGAQERKPSKSIRVGTHSTLGKSWSSVEQSSPSERSIRLRSVRVEDALQQQVRFLSCQDTSHPVTRGFFEKAFSSFSKDHSTIAGTFADDFSSTVLRTNKPNPSNHKGTVLKQGVSTGDISLDSILRTMAEVAQHNRLDSSTKSNSWRRQDSENMMSGTNAENDVLNPKSLFSVRRSKILSEESLPKDSRKLPQTRSLANLLEEWNKGGKSHSLLNGTPPDVRDLSSQLLRRPTRVERMPLTWEETDGSGSVPSLPITALDTNIGDSDRNSEDWHSGKQGRLSVLKEIQQLVADGSTEQALQVLRNHYSEGVHLDDAVYSALFSFTFDDWQKQAVRHAQEKSVIVSAPSSAGKFAVASRCLYQAFVQGERCLVVTPSEVVAKHHWQELQLMFGKKNVAYIPYKEEDQHSHLPITVISLESLIKELRECKSREGSSVNESFYQGLSLAVMDMFHTLGDAQHGSLWEEAIMLLDQKVKLIALSLPMKSWSDIVAWISHIHRPCELAVCDAEPVQKSWYYCNESGLHLLGSNTEKLMSSNSQDSSILESDVEKDFQEHIRVLLRSLKTQKFVPVAVSFSSIEDCVSAMSVAKEEVTDEHISIEEVARIEERVHHFFRANPRMEPLGSKEEIECLRRGFCMFHDAQLPLWTEFLQGLICDNLVKIVFGTNSKLSSFRTSFKTVALFSITGNPDTEKSLLSSGDIAQLSGKAGRRGRDSCGHVIFVGKQHTVPTEVAVLDSDTTFIFHSYFQPTYSLLLNLLSKHTRPEVRQFVERSYGEYCIKKRSQEELENFEGQISDATACKDELESRLFQKLQNLNTEKLQDATILTHVDVRVATSDAQGNDDVLPGVLCAVLQGPSTLLYVILCADNIFRLLPAGALNHVYADEKTLGAVFKSATGNTLRPPPLPLREKWKVSPGDYLAYTSDGTAESARVVEALLDYGVKVRKTEDEPTCRDIRSCTELLSSLRQQREMIFTSRSTATWVKSESLIESLGKADALELASNDDEFAIIKPLGVLISKLHHVENELWFTTALSSSIVKPLTAPELAAICSALLFRSEETDSKSSRNDLGSVNEASIVQDAPPKRVREALDKLENLRTKVENLQCSDCPPVRLDGTAVAAVHSLCRESGRQASSDRLKYQMVLLVQKIITLLHAVDDAWSRSVHVLPVLEGTSRLHNLARKAAHSLEKALGAGR